MVSEFHQHRLMVIPCYPMSCYSITIITTIELPPAAQGRTHHNQQLQGVGSRAATYYLLGIVG